MGYVLEANLCDKTNFPKSTEGNALSIKIIVFVLQYNDCDLQATYAACNLKIVILDHMTKLGSI